MLSSPAGDGAGAAARGPRPCTVAVSRLSRSRADVTEPARAAALSKLVGDDEEVKLLDEAVRAYRLSCRPEIEQTLTPPPGP